MAREARAFGWKWVNTAAKSKATTLTGWSHPSKHFERLPLPHSTHHPLHLPSLNKCHKDGLGLTFDSVHVHYKLKPELPTLTTQVDIYQDLQERTKASTGFLLLPLFVLFRSLHVVSSSYYSSSYFVFIIYRCF
jgi:hypothetical protein